MRDTVLDLLILATFVIVLVLLIDGPLGAALIDLTSLPSLAGA